MNLELDDQAMAHRLREELDGATYHRSTTSFAARSRTPIIAGVAGIASAVVAATVIGGVGSSSPALAWSPTPTAATTADEAAATSACGADLNTGSQRAGNEPVFTLPPLVALDLRGTGGLATFADANMTFTCLLVRDGEGFERGPVVGEETGNSTDSATFGIVSTTSTEWDDGRTIAMITGVAPAGAAAVEIRIAGQPTATADVTDGRFAMWWFGTVENLSGTVSALDAAGAELDRTTLGDGKVDSGRTRG